MSKVEAIIRDVNFSPGYRDMLLEYDDGLGYLRLGEQMFDYNEEVGFWQLPDGAEVPNDLVAANGLHKLLLGFGVPYSREGGADTSNVVTPLVNFNELPLEARSIHSQGKGVGPRMYNTPYSASGMVEVDPTIGAFMFRTPNQIKDRRTSEGGSLERIWRHAGRMARAKMPGIGLEGVVNKVHEENEGYDAILYTQPPRARMRQELQHHAPNPEEVPAHFMIIRNPHILLHRVGSMVPL